MQALWQADPESSGVAAVRQRLSSSNIVLRSEIRWMRPIDYGWLATASTSGMRLAAAFVALLLSCGSAFAVDIHLGPKGSDNADGTNEGNAVATLGRAVDLALALRERTNEPLRVVVWPGTYRGQSLVIDGKRLSGELTIIGKANNPSEFPIFIGDGRQTTWLTVKSSTGERTGLTIQALQIREYMTAISLEGNRDDPIAGNSGTTIRRNIFRRIGSIASAEPGYSTAAIRFVNSKDNIVDKNYFGVIRNKVIKECGALHSLYLAHFSSGNRIVGNTFNDACGSVIKLRDRSNDNQIENNSFSHIENAPVIEEWYCDAGARKDCTKKAGECPSTGNMEKDNLVSESPTSEKISIVGNKVPRKWCSSSDYTRERLTSK